ncbi:MAG: L-aspartate oxidase [Planctomycetota bacterium]|nr:MAG: L-aspartate oxidase [Planctomycetota bacterium]
MDCLHLPGIPSPRYLIGFDLRRKPHLEADVLVLGSGIAGLSAALAAAESGCEVLLLTKGELPESNTRYAQGGVAAVLEAHERDLGDSIQAHFEDTLAAGAGLCAVAETQTILADSPQAIEFLRRYGCRFDGEAQGQVDLTREGGHRFRRILHAHGDQTGAEVVRALTAAVMDHPAITVREHAFALDLLDRGGKVCGALYERRGEVYGALAGATILTTGGCGRIWRETSNPPIATGDGLAMAYRAGAGIADAEFMQFHPTALYVAGAPRLLITEAMRGEGAILKNHDGQAFMANYHEQKDLAPRDVVSRAIIAEIARTRFSHVWLDATHLGGDFLRQRFPTIFQGLAEFGIDIAKEWIPVHPSAHYHCGGILAGVDGDTTLPGLLAAGEVACTGLHGANRLASNSILEGLVCGRRAGLRAAAEGGFAGRVRIDHPHYPLASRQLDIQDLMRSLRALMWRQVGLARDDEGIATAQRTLRFWSEHQARGALDGPAGWELQNMITIASLISQSARERRASVGTHLRRDSEGDIELRHITLTRPAETW